jgi:hypothetical protein
MLRCYGNRQPVTVQQFRTVRRLRRSQPLQLRFEFLAELRALILGQPERQLRKHQAIKARLGRRLGRRLFGPRIVRPIGAVAEKGNDKQQGKDGAHSEKPSKHFFHCIDYSKPSSE